MKTTMILLAAMMVTLMVSGQTEHLRINEVNQPIFKPESISNFLLEEIEYPVASKERGNQGTVVVEFTVNPDGMPCDFRIISGVSPWIDGEVIRALKETGGKWIPGTIDGEPIETVHEIMVTFKLYPDTDFFYLAEMNVRKGNKALYEKHNPARALKYFKRAMKYQPYDASILRACASCKQQLGDHKGYRQDLARVEVLESRNDRVFHALLSED